MGMMEKGFGMPVEEFLRPFCEANEKVYLRIFADRKGDSAGCWKTETTLARFAEKEEELRRENMMNRGIFFVVNAGGHEDKEIRRINAQFVECDDKSFEEQWAQIRAFPLEPSIIVKTRKSLHTYWLMKDAEVGRFRAVQRALIEYFGGDKACVNESRVLRLPGFYHCKAEPVMVECVKFSPELRYTQDELLAAMPECKNDEYVPKAAEASKADKPGLDAVLRKCEFIRHCSENVAELSEHDWYAMISNLAIFEGGDAAIHRLSANYPGYTVGETDAKIAHFRASGTGPMTCQVIAEKGYECPRLKNGLCKCKAPVSMARLPLDTEDLREMIQTVPVSGDVMRDGAAARDFIRLHMYNVAPVDADMLLNYGLRERFKFSAADMKALIAYQHGLYRDSRARGDTSAAADGEELPEWYEAGEKGGLRFLPGALADHMAKNVHVFYGAGTFYNYDDGVYVPVSDNVAKGMVRSFMISRAAGLKQIEDALGQWKMLIERPLRDINANPFVINLRNGLLNVFDGSFREHTPEYLSTVRIGASYRPELADRSDTGCPVFRKFLGEILGGPEIALVQEILGYLMVPVSKAQKAFVFVGAPRAGKSTLLNIAQDVLLGKENVSNITWQSLGDRFNKAELFGKLANMFADLPTKSIDDNGMFKALTGEDYITGERKNKDPFTFRPYARFLFSCNEIPRNYGDRSEGYYRRLILVPFRHSVPEDRIDPDLGSKMAAEIDGIFLWALAGLRRLMANNYRFSETEATRAELARYRTDSSSSLSFAEIYLSTDANAVAFRDDIYDAYRVYCRDSNFGQLSRTAFNREIETRFPGIVRAKDRISRRNIWRGLKFNADGAEP